MGKGCATAVALVGSPLAGDDAAPLHAAGALDWECVVECPYGVELCAHRLRELGPETLVVVDAAVGLEPCRLLVLGLGEAEALLASWTPTTHSLPPRALLAYLRDLAPRVYLALVGVGRVRRASTGLSPAGRCASEAVARLLRCLASGGEPLECAGQGSAWEDDVTAPGGARPAGSHHRPRV